MNSQGRNKEWEQTIRDKHAAIRKKKKKKTFSFLLSPIYYAFRVDGLAPSRSNLDLGKASPTGVGIEWVIDNQATREREREREMQK